MADMNKPINLNVGGVGYTTSLMTLSKYPSRLINMLVRWPPTDDKGAIFIDRDGSLFRHVLNFLRTDQLSLPNDFEDYESLMVEVDFYEIASMREALEDYDYGEEYEEDYEEDGYGSWGHKCSWDYGGYF